MLNGKKAIPPSKFFNQCVFTTVPCKISCPRNPMDAKLKPKTKDIKKFIMLLNLHRVIVSIPQIIIIVYASPPNSLEGTGLNAFLGSLGDILLAYHPIL
ncbi:protein of unknown function [Clostridium beijerinckii]|uniref:Uncharacterized protein n=1 Tax=Clostridium diolis TaxID=223919 RepID=A0AAV3W5A0_9CLOT|nr:hypothetical protein CDIOL_41330 [Clostridium diolis]CUU48267.1 protein of unknown function [Clostridium beijerinckii]